MSAVKKRALTAFWEIISNFFEKYTSSAYKEQIKELLESFQCFEAQMSAKTHFLCSHLDYFPDNCRDYSEEKGAKSHHDFRQMEERYQEYCDVTMLADYCWCFFYSRIFTLTTGDSKRSRLRRLKNGAPKGSVLAPLLFNICVYDLPSTVSRRYAWPVHRAPTGIRGLTVLDVDTRCWLSTITASI